MAEPAATVDDLEDGEIESGDEEVIDNQNEDNKREETAPPQPLEKMENQEIQYSKPGKKKKKSKKSKEQKFKDKHNNRKFSGPPTEDDFAGNIEKAIRKAMNKNDESELFFNDDVEERRKHKKRKKYDGKDGLSKKRKKQDYNDEVDESEMMCVRGASPVQRQSPEEMYGEDDRESYTSESSEESRGHQNHRSQRQRQSQRERNKNNNKNDRRRSGAHPMQDPDGVCLYFMQGKCHKGDSCIYSHDALPPRKMELCKFYLMDCCAKRDKCLYMHADFPCKYYHTGLPCIYKEECKFAHGEPLTDNLKNILLKHIESAPKEILGDFPRLNRDGAMKMIQSTQAKLIQKYSDGSEDQGGNIPSLFELNLPTLPNSSDTMHSNFTNNDRQNKISLKVRQSRWQNDGSNQNYNNLNLSPNSNNTKNVLCIKNLTGVLTSRQISDLSKMGIENLDQLGQLTVLQLNNIGLSLKQITEIQLNTMSIQKLGLINNSNEQYPQSQTYPVPAGTKDMDLRAIPPAIANSNNLPIIANLPGQDIDMRFQPVAGLSSEDNSTQAKPVHQQTHKDLIDIDQYTKDALKFASKDKENIDVSNESFENEKPIISNEIKDIDHRILPFSEDSHIASEPVNVSHIKQECDTDIRFLQPEPIIKTEKKHRRSTTDDEDNNLLIDEKWYSSDEEKGNKIKKSPASSPHQTLLSPTAPAPHVIEPSAVLSRLGDLSKIDISEEVTKLLNTMKNNLNENKNDSVESVESQKPKDPRRTSVDKLTDSPKPHSHKRPPKVSIYECVDGEPTDGRRRSDVDLRKTDYNVPTFGDTDLRTNPSGDIDFRLGLPFKAIPNYTPASEIDGSINSHPPIPFKLVLIDIPRPDYTDIRNSTAKSQALSDPRLRKVFRLSVEEAVSDSEKSSKATTPAGPRVDPRRKLKDPIDSSAQDAINNSLDLQTVLQNSNWYKELSSTQKIFVSQHLTPITQMIKQYHHDKIPGKKFDLPLVQNNTILCSILANLGITLSDNGEFTYLPKPKDALLKTPVNFNQNPFNMNSNMSGPSGHMDSGNMNMMNMPPMGMGGMNNMNMGNMHGFNSTMPDHRGGPTPGLLGIAPNLPHNFNNFGGPNNFGNMPFNGPGPGNDFNFMDGEQNFPRFPNRGGHRGRGNERWNRGARGNRNQKNFNDRGNWKHDRS